MQDSTAQQPKCCGHCLHDLPCALTYALCDATRRSQVHEPYQPWWPANIDSPTVYFQLKRRAMEFQIREQARMRPYSDPTVWRAQHTSASAGAGNALLARRGAHQLSVRLPVACTNLSTRDQLEFVGELRLESPPAAAAAAARVPMQSQQQQQRRAAAAAEQPVPRVLRAHPCCSAPRPPAAPMQQQQQHYPHTQQPLLASSALQPGMAQAHMGLLASLQQHEQYHRQQMAASFMAADATSAAHPAALLKPSWQSSWDLQQLQAQLQAQQQAAAAAAPACSSGWPYAIPVQRQGCWAHASSLGGVTDQRHAHLPQQFAVHGGQAGAGGALAACC